MRPRSEDHHLTKTAVMLGVQKERERVVVLLRHVWQLELGRPAISEK